MFRPSPTSTLFPYTTLFRSGHADAGRRDDRDKRLRREGDRPVMRSDVARADYRRARRRAFMRGVLSWFRRADNALLAFDEVRRGIHAQAQRDGGLREVEIDQIVGSVGRYRDFDRAFLPRQVQTRDRWESVARAHLDHLQLPPVDLYKIGETY